MRKLLNFVVLVLFALPTTLAPAQAQESVDQSGAGSPKLTSTVVSPTGANQALISSLSSLPEADTLVFINPQRILNEVVPKMMPAKDVEDMMKGFEEVKKNFGVDPTRVEYIVIAVRFQKPTADLQFQPPQALIVAGGDFSAEALMGLARMASQGQLRDEKYGEKTLGLMTIDPIAKEAEKSPFLHNFAEVGIAALNGNTIAVGTPGYLRAAFDAVDGKDRISAETLNSLVRDSSVLMSVAGRPWHSFAKSFGMMGTEATERAPGCMLKMGDFYAALTLDATNFMLRGVMNEDNPDTAKIMSNLFSGLQAYALSSIKDPGTQSMLKNLTMAAEGDEVIMRADIPQQMVMDMIKQQMKPKKQEEAVSAPPKKPAKPVRARRRARPRA